MRGSKQAEEIINEKPKPVKTVNEWLRREDLEKGFTIANAKFKDDYSRLWRSLRKQAAYLWFIGVVMGNHYTTKMMYSSRNQAKFCGAVIRQLEKKKVEKEHYHIFFEDVKNIKKRLDTIERITKEDIHLTEYEPFFEAEIYCAEDIAYDFEEIPKMAKAWNEAHKEVVEEHMKKIEPELKRHNEFLRRKAEQIKEEKEARKMARKKENEYVKEIQQNKKKNRQEYERIERSFQRYYEGRE